MELEPLKQCSTERPIEHAGDTKDQTAKQSKRWDKRQTWSSQLDFIMACVGCAVGLGNIWRFPYLCYKNGGGAFLIPYLISFFCAAAPVFILETSIGQYTRAGCVRAWNLVPAFRGLGFAAQVVMAYQSVYYIIVIAWAIYYIAVSFTTELPWATCGNAWNTERCFVSGMTLNTTPVFNCSMTNCSTTNVTSVAAKPVDAVVEFWENGVLRMSDGIETPGKVVPGLALSLFVAWCLVFICIYKGVKWTGKIVYFTALFPYVLLTVIFLRGITLEGSINGIIYYLRPNFTRLADAQVWLEGATQVVYSIGIGQGFMITLGSYNKFHSNCVRNSLIIITVNCLTSIYGGLAVFSILGFMAHELNQSIESVVDSGPGLVFLTYPKAVSQMPLPPLWSGLFFLTIFFVGLDSQFVSIEGFLTPIIDEFPTYLYQTNRRTVFVGVFCTVCFLLGLPMVTEGGVYVFRLIDYYSVSGLVLLTICTFEAVAVGWIFGAERFYDALEIMTGRRFSPWMKVCWKYLAPLIAQGIFWFEISSFKPLKFSSTYEYPTWATAVGVMFIFSSTLCIPITLLVHFCRSSGSFRERWNKITTPILEDHMIHPKWAEEGYRMTLKYRSYKNNI